MACPKCTLRLIRPPKRLRVAIPSQRAFHASPSHNRLGAFTYAQEWQTGTYHYNKALSKTLPVAAQRADELLTIYATQAKRRAERSDPNYHQATKTSIAAQRRQIERVLISKSTAKDLGHSMEVTAFVFDGVQAEKDQREERMKKRAGVNPSAAGGQDRNRSGPAARRKVGGNTAGSTGTARRTGPPRNAMLRRKPANLGPAARPPPRTPPAQTGGPAPAGQGLVRRVTT